MRRGICHGHEPVGRGEAKGIDLSCGSFDQGQSVLERKGVFEGWGRAGQLLHAMESVALGDAIRFEQPEQRRGARQECRADAHRVGEIEQATLKPPIFPKGLVEEAAPVGVAEIAIDGGDGVLVQGATDVVSLHDPSFRHEGGL